MNIYIEWSNDRGALMQNVTSWEIKNDCLVITRSGTQYIGDNVVGNTQYIPLTSLSFFIPSCPGPDSTNRYVK